MLGSSELALARCYFGCRFDLDQPWSYNNYLEGHIVDSVNIVAWALDKVIKECLGDPLSPRVITQTLEKNVWNSTLKLSAALNSTALHVVFDQRARRALPMALGNLVNRMWKVAGVYDPAAKKFTERADIIQWPRTGKLAPRSWLSCDVGERLTGPAGELQFCETCHNGTYSTGGRSTACVECAPGEMGLERASRGPLAARAMMRKYFCAGYFQPEDGQLGCLSCDGLGDAYYAESRACLRLCAFAASLRA